MAKEHTHGQDAPAEARRYPATHPASQAVEKPAIQGDVKQRDGQHDPAASADPERNAMAAWPMPQATISARGTRPPTAIMCQGQGTRA